MDGGEEEEGKGRKGMGIRVRGAERGEQLKVGQKRRKKEGGEGEGEEMRARTGCEEEERATAPERLNKTVHLTVARELTLVEKKS